MTTHVLISGFVQGIGFRYFLKDKAQNLGVKGWVANTQDSRVEAVFQGEEKSVNQMVEYCRQGPFLASVKNVEVKKAQSEKFDGFAIVK